jgi:nucleoside-diphosphate-sugar epimerase
VYVDGLRGVLEKLPRETGRVIYISSTGVYGQAAGDWVDEDSQCRPLRDGGRACLAAEELLRAHVFAQRAIVLRMAGIYGPGRIPRAQELRAGQAIPAPQEGYLNLIHVDDAARVVLAAEQSGKTPGLYVVSDGNPPTRRQYYDELARLLGAPPPRFEMPPADSPAALRAGSDKRVRNERMVNELGVQLLYPIYRQGLASIVAMEQKPQV